MTLDTMLSIETSFHSVLGPAYRASTSLYFFEVDHTLKGFGPERRIGGAEQLARKFIGRIRNFFNRWVVMVLQEGSGRQAIGGKYRFGATCQQEGKHHNPGVSLCC